MKILLSITYFDPYISGLTIYARRLAVALVKQGHRVTVLCMRHDRSLPRQETAQGVTVVRAQPLARISKGFLSGDWLRQSWHFVLRNEVVIVNLPQFEGVIPAILGRLFGKRLVVIYHCEVSLPAGFINSIIQSLLEITNLISLLLAHTVVTSTRDFAAHSRLLKQVRHKVVPIYPPIPRPVIFPREKRKLARKIGDVKVLIGIAGRLAAEKGIEYLLAAIPLIKSKIKNEKFKIVIAGPLAPVGEEAYQRKILALVKKYRQHVVLLGEMQSRQIGVFYSLLDMLVLPSVNSTEAFGMVQVEAMLSGTPVVATNLPGVRVPIQRTGMGIIVPPKNSDSLARAIVEIVTHKEKYIKGSKVMEREFSLKKTINSFQKLI